MPYKSGCRVALTLSIRLTLFGTDKNPSGPASSALKSCVGGLRSRPRTTGVTVLFCDRTTIFDGDPSSVPTRSSGAVLERNSCTFPVREIKFPTLTCLRMVVEVVKTKSPFDARSSLVLLPSR